MILTLHVTLHVTSREVLITLSLRSVKGGTTCSILWSCCSTIWERNNTACWDLSTSDLLDSIWPGSFPDDVIICFHDVIDPSYDTKWMGGLKLDPNFFHSMCRCAVIWRLLSYSECISSILDEDRALEVSYNTPSVL